MLVALYGYESRADGDLSFRKGDIMYLLDSRCAGFSFLELYLDFKWKSCQFSSFKSRSSLRCVFY